MQTQKSENTALVLFYQNGRRCTLRISIDEEHAMEIHFVTRLHYVHTWVIIILGLMLAGKRNYYRHDKAQRDETFHVSTCGIKQTYL